MMMSDDEAQEREMKGKKKNHSVQAKHKIEPILNQSF